METFSFLLEKAREGAFISGFKVEGRGGKGVEVPHLLFADDTLIFCEASKNQLLHLHWVFMWFEAIFGLKINHEKSELISIRRVPRRTVGSYLPSILGFLWVLPLNRQHYRT